MESASLTKAMGGKTQPVPSGMARHSVPLLSDHTRSPPPKEPAPPPVWKEGDTFSLVLDMYSGWKGTRLTPKKQELMTYALLYHDDDDDTNPSDNDTDVSKRIGIKGATEMLQEGARVMGKKKWG